MITIENQDQPEFPLNEESSFAAARLPYHQTGAFSKIVLDYLQQAETIKPFYSEAPTWQGLKNTLEEKQNQPISRAALVAALLSQYEGFDDRKVLQNIEALLSPKTFTVCTAHQPNIFTGPLYFIYKIVHAIQLAAHLKQQYAAYDFVPVYYMGSEDADLQELNHITVNQKKYEWQTDQKGAVGRMFIDKKLLRLLDELEQQLGVQPHGKEIIGLLKSCYQEGDTIQEATFKIVHSLFGRYGLIVLIADTVPLKKQMLQVFEDDLFQHQPSNIVAATCSRLRTSYPVQAMPRQINLFYLLQNTRERIERRGAGFAVTNTELFFTEDELRQELRQHPERFSPNVILRGLYQETILPNIAFIGGGGELAYWLQLKDLFAHYSICFPVLILRNSFLLIEKEQYHLIKKLQLSTGQLFQSVVTILNQMIEREGKKPHLNGELEGLKSIYENLKEVAAKTDVTLRSHVEALQTKTINDLMKLEEKMMRSERRKKEATQRQVAKLKEQLFPKNGLQEREENISGYYAKWGSGFIDTLLQNSTSLEAAFTVLSEI